MKLLSAILTLFFIMDPIGNVPVFVSFLKDVREGRRAWVVMRESLFALGVLLAFLFFGPLLTDLLHVRQESLFISGGVLLFLVAVGMIFPGAGHLIASPDHPVPDDGEPFFVPLAVPLIAGPSTMATIMIFSSQQKDFWLWVGALVIAWILTTAILLLSPWLCRLLGPRGLRACERLMGMILTVLAVQMFLDGVGHFLKAKP
jgi:multiple antibiotic resistance protein